MRFETLRQFVSTIAVNIWYGRQVQSAATKDPPTGQPRPRAFQIWWVLYSRIALALLRPNTNPEIDDQWSQALFQQSQWVTAYANGHRAAHDHMERLVVHAQRLQQLYASSQDYHMVTADMHATWITAAAVLSADAAARNRALYADTTLDELLDATTHCSSLGPALVWAWLLYHLDPVTDQITARLSAIRTQLPHGFQGNVSIMDLFVGGRYKSNVRCRTNDPSTGS